MLSIPGLLSIKILETDPKWATLKDQQEFLKFLKDYKGFLELYRRLPELAATFIPSNTESPDFVGRS